jgi:Tol biopolymer transport system component
VKICENRKIFPLNHSSKSENTVFYRQKFLITLFRFCAMIWMYVMLFGLVMCSLVCTPLAIAQKRDFPQDAHPARKPIRVLHLKGHITPTRLNALNSPFHENNISLTPDGRRMFFMSERGGQPWSRHPDSLTERFDGDIWYAERKNGEWQEPQCLDSTVNSLGGEDEPNISPEGQTVIFESFRPGWQQAGGPYFSAQLQGTTWAKPLGLGGGINLFFTEMRRRTQDNFATDGAALSANHKMFIVACGNDYDANMDLYISRKLGKAGWLYCQKLPVSTDGNERSVFLAADGQTFYFASDGYGGFGGLDIFKATLNDDGSVTDIVNIGEPFNTKADDYGFVVSADGSEAYFARNGDLYMTKLGSAMNEIKPRPVAILSGTITDGATSKIVQAKISLRTENDEHDVSSDALSGYYSSVVRSGKTYKQVVSAAGFKDFTRTFTVPASTKFTQLDHDVQLKPLVK